MMHLTCLYACAITAFLVTLFSVRTCAYMVPKGFRIKSDDVGFRISVKGVEVLVHTTTEPMILVGNVQTTFKEHHGNWHIDEQVRQKVGLPRFAFTEREFATDLRLWLPEGPQVELMLDSEDFNPLVMWWVTIPEGYDRVWVRLPAQKDERVYGAGAQYDRFDLRGYSYPIWFSDQGVGHNKSFPVGPKSKRNRMSFFPLPTFVSSRHYYCHVRGSNYVHLNFQHSKYHEISIYGQPKAVYFNINDSFEALIRAMTYFLWRQPRLPDWVHTGAILGVQGGTNEMLAYYEEAKAAGVEVAGLWIQDWSGMIETPSGKRVYNDWVWSEKHYPGLVEEIMRLKAKGVRVLTYVTPNLHSKGTLFEEADKKGYLIKNKNGDTYLQDLVDFSSGTVDLTNPEAFSWYKGVLTHNLIDLGFGGWMADLSEDTPVDVLFHNGVDARHMHNAFPVLWARLNREIINEADKVGEIMFFMRIGGVGSSKYTTMTWAGYQNADWSLSDGLPTVIPAALSLCLSGVGLTHFDIGLPMTTVGPEQPPSVTAPANVTRSPELLLRTAELAVFTAIMRTHGGNQRTGNWRSNWSRETLERFGTLTRQYHHLVGYRMAVERQHYRQGLPMQRPLFLHYQEDAESFTAGYQYLLGQDLLVAPVIAPGVTTWEVYLPSDTWEHLWSGQVYVGPVRVSVQAPLGEPPVFFREASVWSDTFRGLKNIVTESDKESDKVRVHGEL